MRAAGAAAGSLSLRLPLRRWEGGGTSGLCVRWVRGRVRVEGDAAEAAAVVSRRNKVPRAPVAVRRGSGLRLGASGVGDPRISSRSRAMVSGGPSALAGWVLRWAMDAWRRRPFFLLVGMICCCSSLSSALMLEGDPALPGRMARPRCWTGRLTRVLFLPEGTLFAVLKAKDGDGCYRCVLDWCPCPLGAGVKERGSSVAAIVPWSKMMTCLRLVADLSAAGVFSQDSGMMTQGSGDLHVLWFS